MTIIVRAPEPWRNQEGSAMCSHREFNKVDRLAEQLAKAAGFEVPIIEGSVAQAPKDGFLFVYEPCERADLAALGPRIILMNASRGKLMSGKHESLVADFFSLAGAVEDQDYFAWENGPGNGRIHGLVSVAEKIGLYVGTRMQQSDYAFISRFGLEHTMGEVFVDYLTAYEEMGLHTRAPKGI